MEVELEVADLLALEAVRFPTTAHADDAEEDESFSHSG